MEQFGTKVERFGTSMERLGTSSTILGTIYIAGKRKFSLDLKSAHAYLDVLRSKLERGGCGE